MTVFVGGVHGVGKSYLCQQYALEYGVLHESASGLIRRERSQAQWSADKKVQNVEDNQQALKSAVNRINAQGQSLLLDGHFVLINTDSEIIPIDVSVFRDLNLTGIVLIETSSEVIVSRLSFRDSSKSAVAINLFIQAEKAHAKLVCDELKLSLDILFQPTHEVFAKVVSRLLHVS